MPRSKSRKSARSKGPRLHKQVLLPLPNDYVRDQSLACHLALIGCGADGGSRHSLNELIRVTYLSFLLWEAGYGDAELQLFASVEAVLDTAVVRAQQTSSWRLESAESTLMERVLRLHDEQLSGVPTRSFLSAQARLEILLNREKTMSPIRRDGPIPGSSFAG